MEYLVGIYARLSVEHGNAKDNSIQNQIRLAKQWLEEQNAKPAQKKIRCESLSEKQKEDKQATIKTYNYFLKFKTQGFFPTHCKIIPQNYENMNHLKVLTRVS